MNLGSCYVMKSQVMFYLPSQVYMELFPEKNSALSCNLAQALYNNPCVSEQYQKLIMTAANNSKAGSYALLT